ncbi:restriction endonuclease subunit S [Vibrio scophthalmi]|uniref:Type I site-specific deoxyribonuclease n=1 Tax=Vibrio scophthalmi TaxID=45658 RepID=A0A1C7FER9_9VIBR|nr:restriction endonuclease subunit S [Vibrio scophthalmi]ANU38197.1 Type I site-specific deoxyribonuclease [Vibrio scophthalmi]
MSCNWIELPLGDFIELKRGYDLPKGKRKFGDYPIVSSAGTTDYHAEFKVTAPGVVTGRYGTIGEVFYVDIDFWPLNTTLYVKDFKGNCPEFVYYLLKTFDFHKYSDKAAVPGVNRNHLHMELVRVPDSYESQKKIAEYISKIDKKVSINQQLNQTLEAMAQAIFKSWFVDFDPVKAKMNGEQPAEMDVATASLFPEKLVESEIGLIPEGWVETPLYDIAEYINGAAYKKFEPNNEGIGLPIVKIAELKAGITQKTGFSTVDMPAKYRLEDNDILFSWSGNPDTSIDTFVWALGEAWLNQHIFKVVPKSVLSRDYVLCLLKFMRPVFAEIARDKQTTGLGHVTVKDLKRLTVALPSEELLIKFNEKVSAIIAQNFSLVKQNQNLEKLRDTLLPKLLSGEIELGNLQVEQVKALVE